MKSWNRAVAVVLAGVVTACSGADAPTSIPVRPATQIAGEPAECEDAGRIKQLISALFPSGAVNDAQVRFATINRQYCARSSDAAGKSQMLQLVSIVVTKYATGALNNPTRPASGVTVPASTLAATFELLQRLYAYVGLDAAFTFTNSDQLGTAVAVVPDRVRERALWDGAISLAAPNQSFQIVSSSGNFASVTDATFFRASAVVAVYRLPDGAPFQATFKEYPPRYQIEVYPATAQANYPGAQAVTPVPLAHTAVCPYQDETEHPHPEHLRLLRNPDQVYGEGGPQILPEGNLEGAALLRCNEVADAPPGGYTSPGDGTVAAAARGAGVLLARMRSSLAAAFLPRAAYAVDGGAGGDSRLYSGFVPVDPNPYRFVGSAAPIGAEIRLTSDVANQAGAVWLPGVAVGGGFTASFTFRTAPVETATSPRGDGLAFVVQNSSLGAAALGAAGGGLGYQGIERSVAVEFDMWDNILGDFRSCSSPTSDAAALNDDGDPDANHVAVHTRGREANCAGAGARIAVAPVASPNMSDGKEHAVTITYTPVVGTTPGTLKVKLDGIEVVSTPFDIGLSANTDGFANIGVTAGTGQAAQAQFISHFHHNSAP